MINLPIDPQVSQRGTFDSSNIVSLSTINSFHHFIDLLSTFLEKKKKPKTKLGISIND